MYVTPAFLYLLEPGQEKTLGQIDMLILNCAVEAKLSKPQWDEMLEQVGAKKIEDVLLVNAAGYEECGFKPVLKNRLETFQSALYANYWRERIEGRDEEDFSARGSVDAVAAAPPAPKWIRISAHDSGNAVAAAPAPPPPPAPWSRHRKMCL